MSKEEKLEKKIKKYIDKGEKKGYETASALAATPALAFLLQAEDAVQPEQMSMIKELIRKAKKIDPKLNIHNMPPFSWEDNPLSSFIGKRVRHGMSSYWPKPLSELMGGKGGRVVYGGDPHILMHELGHATALGDKGWPRLLASKLAIPLGLVAAAATAKSDDYAEWAPTVAAAGTIPLLAEEALASGIALKQMYKSLGKWEVLKGLAKLGPAFATYAALPYGLYKGTQWAAKKIKKKKAKMSKTASIFTLGFIDGLRRIREHQIKKS